MSELISRVKWEPSTSTITNQGILTNDGNFIALRQGDWLRSRFMTSISWQGLAFTDGINWSTPAAASFALPVVAAGNGGAVMAPISIYTPMLLQEFWIHSSDAASLRTAEWRLFYDRRNWNNILDEFPLANGTFSFTPAATSWRSSTPASAPVLLAPGCYYAVVRNTSAAQTFGISGAAAGLTGTPNAARTGSIAALTSTILPSTIVTTSTRSVHIALRGRIGGEATGF